MKNIIKYLSFLFIYTCVTGQDKEEEKWNVSNPPGTFKEVTINVNEGTWMNLDVSPDGKEIVFDLLGDIFIIPVTGGNATVLRSGLPFEVQPRFSPSGKHISFTSDAGGGDNIWIMNRDGSNARQVTKEDFRLLNNAVWSPSGDYLVARKHFTSARSLGAGELWMYHKSGGEGVQLTKRKNDQQDLGEPVFSPDGRYIYYSEDMYPGGYFQYNKDPNAEVYVIKRYDTRNGEIEKIAGGPGGAFRPQISADGTRLSFVRRVREKTVLVIHDLDSGEEWPLYRDLTKDQLEAWAIFGVYPNYCWMPDNKSIIIWTDGKINRVDVETGEISIIPFTVNVKHRITDAVSVTVAVAPDSFDVKAIRQTVSSPDGKFIVFNAAGHLYKKKMPSGKPVRLTASGDFEFEPSFSPDGRSVVYVTWSDENMGSVSIVPVSGNTKPTKITSRKGIYRTPRFSPDGKMIVYRKDHGNDDQGYAYSSEAGIYYIPAKGGQAKLITKKGSEPYFEKSGERIFYQDSHESNRALKSINIDGKEERTHYVSKYANAFVPSPDNNWVAFTELFRVYVAPMPPAGKAVDLSGNMKGFPVSKTARDAGIGLHWSAKSDKINWTSGDEYYSADLKNSFSFIEGSPDSLPKPDTSGIKIGLRIPFDKPTGVIAIKGARIITMDESDTVIENGVIVISENRITKIGKEGEVEVPGNAYFMDAKGKTIMPGMIDVHAHLGTFRQGLSPQKQWSYYANLAYGVTTTHDPSSNSEMVFSQSEMVKAGVMTGPRIFSTGWILYGADGDFKAVINSPEDAMSAVRRTRDYGAFSVKSYNQPRREQNQMIIDAAGKLGMAVVPEGGSFFFHNMAMIADGHTGIEHNIPVAPLYEDVISFWSASNTAYTPTLIVCYGAVMGENYWYQKTNVWENEKLLKFTPKSIIDTRSRHRTMIPDKEHENGFMLVSKSVKKLNDNGVKINLGAHGQLQGLGAHWELWMLAMGGMSNMEALKCATVNGAKYLGMDKDIGSLETGKLADLVIMEKNPLENIRNSESITHIMVNGRLYDAPTMNETGNHKKTRETFYWENDRYAPGTNVHTESHGDGD